MRAPRWWQSGVIYQVYPRSFQDSDGDGIGDLAGITARLDHFTALGVDAIWVSPIFPSPMVDFGYDVADYNGVDPLFGSLADFDALLAACHARGLKLLLDFVPNHSSDQHPWFVESRSSRDNPKRDWYIWRDPAPDGGPPNNWISDFGGSAWQWDVATGQYYYHAMLVEQPDLNWRNPDLKHAMLDAMRFWLERGVDGFRIDVAHGMAKPPGLPDMSLTESALLRNTDDDPRFNNDGVHDIHRGIRSVLNEYPDAVTIGEIWVFDNEEFAKYLRPDELHLGFNFRLVRAEFDAAEVREAIENSLAAAELAGSPATWTLSNHDVEREVSRYGGGEAGLAKARAMALVMLALPGAVFVYNGEELGLPNVELPDEVLQDPVWERSGYEERGRDGCRVPMPWSGDTPPFGFSASDDVWLPMPPEWAVLTVAAQEHDPESTLVFFRRAVELRHGRESIRGAIEFVDSPTDVLSFRGTDGVTCMLNTGSSPVPLPNGELLIASATVVGGELPPDAAAWVR